MAPVFSLVLDQDVSEDIAMLYPELYKELTKVKSSWLLVSTFSGVLTSSVGSIFVIPNVLHLAIDQCLSRWMELFNYPKNTFFF